MERRHSMKTLSTLCASESYLKDFRISYIDRHENNKLLMFSRRTVQQYIHETLKTYRQLAAESVIDELLDACMQREIVTEIPSEDSVIVNNSDTCAFAVEIKYFSFS